MRRDDRKAFCLSFLRQQPGAKKPGKRYYLVARSDEEADEWVQTLEVVMIIASELPPPPVLSLLFFSTQMQRSSVAIVWILVVKFVVSWMCVCVRACVQVCVCVCMNVCVFLFVFVLLLSHNNNLLRKKECDLSCVRGSCGCTRI